MYSAPSRNESQSLPGNQDSGDVDRNSGATLRSRDEEDALLRVHGGAGSCVLGENFNVAEAEADTVGAPLVGKRVSVDGTPALIHCAWNIHKHQKLGPSSVFMGHSLGCHEEQWSMSIARAIECPKFGAGKPDTIGVEHKTGSIKIEAFRRDRQGASRVSYLGLFACLRRRMPVFKAGDR